MRPVDRQPSCIRSSMARSCGCTITCHRAEALEAAGASVRWPGSKHHSFIDHSSGRACEVDVLGCGLEARRSRLTRLLCVLAIGR
jgi:hypothetical protein